MKMIPDRFSATLPLKNINFQRYVSYAADKSSLN